MARSAEETMPVALAEPLVLIPGLLCSPALYAPQVAAFGDGRPVSVADHTRSDRLDAIAQDILAVAPARFALAGLSMGGYIALMIQRLAPERVTRIALLDTSARPDVPERTADRRRLMEIARTEGVRRVQGLLLARLIHPARLGEAELVETVLHMAEHVGLDAFLRQQEAIISRPDARHGLGNIRCPALVLVGEQDLQTPPDIADEIASGIPGARLVKVPDCGHLSTLERPEAVNRALAEWLAA
jgi:pimeloyl-ACP methyl ester carboxylesterase